LAAWKKQKRFYNMTYHSSNGQEFAGLRSKADGAYQVVYDTQIGQRIVLEISDPKANLCAIDAALREGFISRNALAGVLNALKVRDIGFE
jgi:SH3-like domain-containing protein